MKEPSGTKTIIEKEGGDCVVLQVDVSKSKEVRAMVERCIDIYGRVDILHNNVGVTELGGAVDASEESWDRVMAVNLKSQFLTCKYVLPYMEKQGEGAIVVQADDVDGFARALEMLLTDDDLRAEMGRNAYHITVPYFTWQNQVPAFLDEIEENSRLE